MKKVLFTIIGALALSSGIAQIEKTCFRGAFAPSPSPMWTDTWAEWDPQNKVYPAPTVTVSSNITTNTTWSTGQTVLITAPIYVKNNSVLTIQPGVIIRGQKLTTASIIVTKGSQIIANGTVTAPIVFTSAEPVGQRNLGDWGGVIILGKAINNNSGGIGNIEGLPISADTEYGGTDDNDNSGVLKYVRIEYAGIQYQPNQEINSLTMGAVGRGTVIDYVQTSFGNDDAFEWFAGSVNCKHLVSYRNLDDDFDTDYGFSGKVQFCLAVRDPNLADNPSVSTSEIFESDNNPTGAAATPYTQAIFSNVTAIGPLRGVTTNTYASGYRRGARIRRASQLKIYNSIFMDNATRALFIDGSACENSALAGTLKFKNNILAGYGQRATEQGTFGIINTNTFVIANANDTLKSSANILTTPYSYLTPDYRPSVGSIAMAGSSFTDAALAAVTGTSNSTVLVSILSSTCIGQGTTVTGSAEFVASTTVSPDYCSLSWSVSPGVTISNTAAVNPSFTITTLGTFSVYLTVGTADGMTTSIAAITTNTCLDVSIKETSSLISSINLFPNPSNEATTLTVSSKTGDLLNVNVYDLTGKMVLSPVQNQQLINGENKYTLNTQELTNGIYFVTLSTINGKETVKLVVNK
jgi:hypothetical protein